MAGFGSDAIAVVSDGLRRSTGSFAERLMSHGLVGNILSEGKAISRTIKRLLLLFKRRRLR